MGPMTNSSAFNEHYQISLEWIQDFSAGNSILPGLQDKDNTIDWLWRLYPCLCVRISQWAPKSPDQMYQWQHFWENLSEENFKHHQWELWKPVKTYQSSILNYYNPDELIREYSSIFIKDGGNWQIVTTIVHELSRKITILNRTIFPGFSW